MSCLLGTFSVVFAASDRNIHVECYVIRMYMQRNIWISLYAMEVYIDPRL